MPRVRHTAKGGGWNPVTVKPPVYVPPKRASGGGGYQGGYNSGGGSTGSTSEYQKVADVAAQANLGATADRIDAGAIYAMVHLVLAVGGMVPVVGEVADGVDAGVCALEDDLGCAALAGAGAIPFLGWGSGAVRIGRNIDKIADAAMAATHAYPIEELRGS